MFWFCFVFLLGPVDDSKIMYGYAPSYGHAPYGGSNGGGNDDVPQYEDEGEPLDHPYPLQNFNNLSVDDDHKGLFSHTSSASASF